MHAFVAWRRRVRQRRVEVMGGGEAEKKVPGVYHATHALDLCVLYLTYTYNVCAVTQTHTHRHILEVYDTTWGDEGTCEYTERLEWSARECSVHAEREREREKEGQPPFCCSQRTVVLMTSRGGRTDADITHHHHTHTQKQKAREREREK